jgi:hypothetical protein
MDISSRLGLGSMNAGVIEATFDKYSTLLKEVGRGMTTPFVKLGVYQWAVAVFLTASAEVSASHLTCSLVGANNEELAVNATFSLIDRDGKDYEDNRCFFERFGSNESWGYPCIISHEELVSQGETLLVHDTLRIRIRIHSAVSSHPVITMCQQDSHYVYFGFNASAFTRSGCLPRDKVCSGDVLICTPDTLDTQKKPWRRKAISAHKYVLALHSPVFRAMFKTGMKEAATNTIEIMDFTEPVVHAFVTFLYEERCAKSVLYEHALQLWRMADKYQVPALTAVCEHYLISVLDSTNVIELVVLAEEHSMADLRAKALAFVRNNITTVLERASFTDLPASVAKDMLREVTAKT